MHKRIIKGMVMLMTICLALTAEAGKLPKVLLPQEVVKSFAGEAPELMQKVFPQGMQAYADEYAKGQDVSTLKKPKNGSFSPS